MGSPGETGGISGKIATLGEEVVDPARTIPRAIPIALGITLLVYGAVAVSALMVIDAKELARSPAPLAVAVQAGRLCWLAPAVRVGAPVASLGVLLSLIAGVSRTAFSMASNRDLPHWLAAVHPRYRVPHRAELAVGALVATAAGLVDLRSAIGFSSFTVLTYYGIANASAWTLSGSERRWPRCASSIVPATLLQRRPAVKILISRFINRLPCRRGVQLNAPSGSVAETMDEAPRWLAGAGMAGCAAIGLSLPLPSVVGGTVLLAAGALAYWGFRRNKDIAAAGSPVQSLSEPDSTCSEERSH